MDGLKLADEFGGRAVLAGIEDEGLVASGGEVEVEGFEAIGIETVEEVLLHRRVVIEDLQGIAQPGEVFGIKDAVLVRGFGYGLLGLRVFTPAFQLCPLADRDDPTEQRGHALWLAFIGMR